MRFYFILGWPVRPARFDPFVSFSGVCVTLDGCCECFLCDEFRLFAAMDVDRLPLPSSLPWLSAGPSEPPCESVSLEALLLAMRLRPAAAAVLPLEPGGYLF